MNTNAIFLRRYERKNRYYLFVLGVILLVLGIHNTLMLIGLEKLTLKNLADIAIIALEILLAWLYCNSLKSYLLVSDEGLEIKDYWGTFRIYWFQISKYNTENSRIILNKPLETGKYSRYSVLQFNKPKTEISLSPFLSKEDFKELERILEVHVNAH